MSFGRKSLDLGRSLRFVENRKSKILPFALIGWCFSDGDFQSLAPYGVDENENENSDDSVLLSVASLAATFRIVTSITSTMAVSCFEC